MSDLHDLPIDAPADADHDDHHGLIDALTGLLAGDNDPNQDPAPMPPGVIDDAGGAPPVAPGVGGGDAGGAPVAPGQPGGEVELPVTPDPVTPDPVTPDPVTPDPVTPDPVTPDPIVLDPTVSTNPTGPVVHTDPSDPATPVTPDPAVDPTPDPVVDHGDPTPVPPVDGDHGDPTPLPPVDGDHDTPPPTTGGGDDTHEPVAPVVGGGEQGTGTVTPPGQPGTITLPVEHEPVAHGDPVGHVDPGTPEHTDPIALPTHSPVPVAVSGTFTEVTHHMTATLGAPSFPTTLHLDSPAPGHATLLVPDSAELPTLEVTHVDHATGTVSAAPAGVPGAPSMQFPIGDLQSAHEAAGGGAVGFSAGEQGFFGGLLSGITVAAVSARRLRKA